MIGHNLVIIWSSNGHMCSYGEKVFVLIFVHMSNKFVKILQTQRLFLKKYFLLKSI